MLFPIRSTHITLAMHMRTAYIMSLFCMMLRRRVARTRRPRPRSRTPVAPVAIASAISEFVVLVNGRRRGYHGDLIDSYVVILVAHHGSNGMEESMLMNRHDINATSKLGLDFKN